MNTNSSTHSSLLKSILLFMGSAAFAYCFCAFLHEGGHLIANEAVGSPRTGMSLHPFGWNYNLYLNEDDTFWHLNPEDENAGLIWAINGGSGPIFNLLVGVTIGLLFWKKRSPALLPFLMIGCVALLMEGFPMLEQAFGGGGDWYYVINGVGVPKALVVLLGVICFAGGCIWMLQLLPLAGISAQDPFWRRLVVLLAGLPLFISGTVFYQLLFGVDLFVPSWNQYETVSYIVIKHLIELGTATIAITAITALHRPLSSWLDRLSRAPVAQVRWQAVLVSIGLAVVIIAVQWVFFNDPTAQVLT
jgi:hypothetical protein